MIYYGQHKEDEYLASLFDNNYKGTCIEIGAYDGIYLSNTYHFELKGWNTLCIEPIETSFNKCSINRKNSINCCISDKDKEDASFYIFELPGNNLCAISGLIPDQRLIDSHSHMILNKTECNVKVRSLTSLLDELNYPTNIDFISIDTENTELDVLKGIDFNKYNIQYMVIENNYDEPFCEDYLKQYGYVKINRISVNDFYKKK